MQSVEYSLEGVSVFPQPCKWMNFPQATLIPNTASMEILTEVMLSFWLKYFSILLPLMTSSQGSDHYCPMFMCIQGYFSHSIVHRTLTRTARSFNMHVWSFCMCMPTGDLGRHGSSSLNNIWFEVSPSLPWTSPGLGSHFCCLNIFGSSFWLLLVD